MGAQRTHLYARALDSQVEQLRGDNAALKAQLEDLESKTLGS